MLHPDEANIVFKTAARFIKNTNHPVFLTGKAGTGKTTFLKYIRDNSRKNTAIVAPTGVAAINAGGTTIHSFFQLPFGPFLPVSNSHGDPDVIDKHSLFSKIKLSTERKEVMQQLELLIIDEISMVRCDVLDAMDFILRHVRNRFSVPFGGVQVLYIGDMYQLPPVIKNEEWKILSSCYTNPFFFSSKIIAESTPVYIELQKVYRQHDQDFIDLLNEVRNNELEDAGYKLLHQRLFPDFDRSDEKIITLTTHNIKADKINTSSLARLPGTATSHDASITGDFSEKIYPADLSLQLKPGAQVMFLKNDTEKIRRYFNGKIGTIHKIETDKIWVSIETEGKENIISVKKETWENIRYSLNNKSNQIEDEVIGSFSQYPLRLAWAITIHKSQGLTFQNVVIDAESAFAPGQVYVALSRCTTLDGIILKSRISRESLRSDERIVAFAKKQQHAATQDEILQRASHRYQCETIHNLLDFKKEENTITELAKWVSDHPYFGNKMGPWLADLKIRVKACRGYGAKFQNELQQYFSEEIFPEENERLRIRLATAATWFHKELEAIKTLVTKSPALTDNRQHARDYNKKLEALFHLVSLHIHLLDSGRENFSMENMRAFKNSYVKEPLNIDAYSGKKGELPGDMPHPELYHSLKDKRNELCEKYHSPVYMVCGSKSLLEMVNYLPTDISDLSRINGFGPAKIKKFGKDFIEIIKNYCDAEGLESHMMDLPGKVRKKSKEKTDTKKVSFDLYRSGKSVDEIARERNFTTGTIEGHLTPYIESGDIPLTNLMAFEKIKMLREIKSENNIEKYSLFKELVPLISYNEIRWFLASEKFEAESIK